RVVGREDLHGGQDGVRLRRVEHHGLRDLRQGRADAARGEGDAGASDGNHGTGQCSVHGWLLMVVPSIRTRSRPSFPFHGVCSTPASLAWPSIRHTGTPGAKPEVSCTSYDARGTRPVRSRNVLAVSGSVASPSVRGAGPVASSTAASPATTAPASPLPSAMGSIRRGPAPRSPISRTLRNTS